MSRRKKERELPDWDDGRTVANMNVDGMPWYIDEAKRHREQEQHSGSDDAEPLTRAEKRAMLGGVLGATLLVGAVFALAFLAFILFCVFVWFK